MSATEYAMKMEVWPMRFIYDLSNKRSSSFKLKVNFI